LLIVIVGVSAPRTSVALAKSVNARKERRREVFFNGERTVWENRAGTDLNDATDVRKVPCARHRGRLRLESGALKAPRPWCNPAFQKPLHTMPDFPPTAETETRTDPAAIGRPRRISAPRAGFCAQRTGAAVGLAFLAGLVLTVLPVGRLLACSCGWLCPHRPVLLVLGAVKLCEEIENETTPEPPRSVSHTL